MTDAEAYQRYWAGLTGRMPSDVYVPRALRLEAAQDLTGINTGTDPDSDGVPA